MSFTNPYGQRWKMENLLIHICQLIQIVKSRTTLYHLASNGHVQRFRRTLLQLVKPLLHPIIRACNYNYRKNRLICKGHLSFTYDFITEYQGRMQTFYACMQYGYKCIHVSRVTSLDLHTCILLASVARSPHSLAGFKRAV